MLSRHVSCLLVWLLIYWGATVVSVSASGDTVAVLLCSYMLVLSQMNALLTVLVNLCCVLVTAVADCLPAVGFRKYKHCVDGSGPLVFRAHTYSLSVQHVANTVNTAPSESETLLFTDGPKTDSKAASKMKHVQHPSYYM